ncbi:sensor histidine kinase [Sphingobium indicum]|uniref:histidine kinase n=2 Tax=Sphingobium indicum TaxID=332055 RepID=A0A1L5BNT4_SPHIB|nr:HWE histidine kinase domain-containing protein [Sphingobium indicum]APL94555.1 histidine kinase [Sphingobium indicum B90A]KEY97686.1 histidine kinase [Sphingomonas sp. BHC-A]NYI23313.1 two-component sensor histidine kinase [Sphingobium indicum]RYM04303.1 sensor histidine kinase [Sphingobium indicum]
MTTPSPTDGWSDFLALFDACPLPQVQVGPDDAILRANAALTELLGIRPERLIGGRLVVPASGESAARLSWDDGKCEARLFAAVLVATPDYRICVVQFSNVDAMEAAARQYLLRNVQHRLRNLIASVRSIFRRTAATSDSIDHLTSHFLGRLDAIARIESNLALAERHGLELHDLVMDELAAFAVRAGEQAFLEGPDIRLRTSAATTLALAFHELGNNSIKYGALGSDGGQVWLRWWSDREQAVPMLRILWEEKSSDAPPAVRRSGFGTELLTKTIPFELDGSGTIDWTPDAFKVHISLPMTKRLLHPSD